MIFKYSPWRILLRVILLVATISLIILLIIEKQYTISLIFFPIVIWQIYGLYRFQKKAHDELSQFVESVHYRDFSRNFDVKHAPGDLKPLRKGFNAINSTFKLISREK